MLQQNKKCDGRCSLYHDCKSEVKTVEVFCDYFDDTDEYRRSWGVFNYCEKAIEVDRKNKFYVKILE